MLYHLLYPLHDYWSVLNVFRYITFRAAYATVTALLISFLLGPWFIARLRAWNMGQQIREDGPATHQVKAGTPTMGGVAFMPMALIVGQSREQVDLAGPLRHSWSRWARVSR